MKTKTFSHPRWLGPILLVAALGWSGYGCAKGDVEVARPTPPAAAAPVEAHGQSSVVDKTSDPNALQVAASSEDFSTLVAAVKAAGLEDSLVNAGPLTVFAPLNSAFDKLPAGTVETLLKPENKPKLSEILQNHVAPANYPVEQLKKDARKKRSLYMASGQYLTVEERPDGVYVGGAKIQKTIKVSNGWVHVIDSILLPTEGATKEATR